MIPSVKQREKIAKLIFRGLARSKWLQLLWCIWTEITYFVTLEVLEHKFFFDENVIAKIKED